MKKVMRLLLILLALTLVITSCTPGGKDTGGKKSGNGDSKVPDPIDVSKLAKVSASDTVISEDILVGEMLTLTSLTEGAESVVNNRGMSGLKAPNHLHAAFDSSDMFDKNFAYESMYYSDKAEELIFDVGTTEALGKMYIWNLNDISKLDSGIQWIDLQYSIDGESYKRLGTYALAPCVQADNEKHNGNMATNTVDGNKPIDFGGVPARYIKIIPLTNWGGDEYGLSEIRVFRHKITPSKGEMIFAEAWENNSDSPAYNLVNNTGMSDLGSTVGKATGSNNPKDMWTTSNENPTLVFNLDGTYPISQMEIWNYNDPDNLDYGAKEIKVYYTVKRPYEVTRVDGKEYCDFSKGDWRELGTYELEKGTGKDNVASSLTIDFEGVHAQHIKFEIVSNHGGKNIGLSEVRVYSDAGWAVEPSRRWSGLMSSSGSFPYQGNHSTMPFAGNNNGSGWIGADGIISTSLDGVRLPGEIKDDSKTIITFQDSFIGNFGNYRRFDMEHGFGPSNGFNVGMKNMAYIFVDGKEPDPRNVQWHHELEGDLSKDHPLRNIVDGQYWLAYSVRLNDYLYTLAAQFEGLTLLGQDLIRTPIAENGFPTMSEKAEKIIKDNASMIDGVDYESIYQEGDYIYQFGRKNNRLVVCRIHVDDFPTGKGYKYWDGRDWVDDHTKVSRISNYRPGNEFNITYMTSGVFANKYVNVYTEGDVWGEVAIAVSDKITGPFEKVTNLYFATESYEFNRDSYKDLDIVYTQWNYNAKSQPALSTEGELLINYHFGLHDDRVPSWGIFNAVGKEYEHPTFIRLIEVK